MTTSATESGPPIHRRARITTPHWFQLLCIAPLCCAAATAASAQLANPRPPATSTTGAAQATASAIEALSARLKDIDKAVRRGDVAAAAGPLDALIADITAAGDRGLLAQALMHRGWVANRRAEYDESFLAYEQARDAARAVGDGLIEGRALLFMAQVRKNTGRYPDALLLDRESRSVFESIGDRKWRSRSWQLEGSVHDLMGEYRQALQSYERARGLVDAGDAGYGVLLNEIGITWKNLGEYEKAQSLYQSALDIHARNKDAYSRAVTLHNLGVLASLLGDHERAIERFEESLTLSRELGDIRGQAILLGNIGEAAWRLGGTDRALAAIEQQRDLAQQHEIRYAHGQALQSLGAIAIERGDWALARQQYGKALELERAGGGVGSQASVLVALSEIGLGQSRVDEARKLASQALEMSREAGSPEDEWRANLAMARVGRAAGKPDEALRHLRAGVEIVDSVRGRVLTDSGKIGYFDERLDLYHELVATLQEQKRPAESLEVAEAARGRALNDLLAGKALRGHGGDGARVASIRDAEARLRAQAGWSSTDAIARATLMQTRAATSAAIETQLRSLREADRELASLVVAEPISAAEIGQTARRLQATMVEYLVTRERLHIWVISPMGEVRATSTPVTRAQLRKTVQELHARLNGLDAAALRNPGPVRALLRQIHGWTIGPVAGYLPRDPDALVYLIAHDALLLVPFAALEDTQGRAVLRSHTVATAPSIAALRYTAGKKRSRVDDPAARLLALADPTPPTDAAFDSLPGSRAEVRSIRRRFPRDRALALEGDDASEANVKQLAGAQSIVHFAVHGLIRDDRPWESALILSAGKGEDGWLKIEELFDLQLQADLVVLSGCSTGTGKLSGEGILGLARALLYAGTPSVVVSQWDVSDLSTAHLMDRFYAGLVAGRSKAQALRAAQLATLERYPHPALWAAFVLVGEPQ